MSNLYLNFRLRLNRVILPVWHFVNFTIPHWVLVIRYGGKDNIPQEQISNVFKNIDMSEVLRTMDVTAATHDLGKFFGLDYLAFEFSKVMGRFIRAELYDVEELQRILDIRESDNVHQAVYDELRRRGDLPDRLVAFKLHGETKFQFEQWLAAGYRPQKK